MKLLLEIVATDEEARALRRVAGIDKHLLGDKGKVFFIQRDDGFLDMQFIQLAELEDVPRLSILRVQRLPD